VILPGTTPAAPDDAGDIDPLLEPLLATGTTEEVGVALLGARLLVPVVALPAEEGDADMSVPALVNEAGKRALPVFSSYDALRAWRADARPVPMSGARVMAGARAEGYDGVVLDVAGPHPHTFAIG
jgi:hypothetical protein